MKYKVWEYKVETAIGPPYTHQNTIKSMGNQGWELVTVVPYVSSYTTSYGLYFKREMKNVGI